MIKTFKQQDLKELWRPREDSSGEDNGQVTIIGGSSLFHGALMFAIKAASRLVDMVFFGSPERDLEKVAKLNSFIWVPWDEIEEYVTKSDAVLIGPGMMRYHKEKSNNQDTRNKQFDEVGTETRKITEYFLKKFPDKKWVIDGGSLQTMETDWIPRNAILTPNGKEFELLFSTSPRGEVVIEMAKKYHCVIVSKGPVGYVTDGETTYEINGGNAGLTKGGTGDTLAGIIVGLLAKNPPLLAATAGTYMIKKTAEELYKKVGYNFNADDVAENVFRV